MNSIDVIKDVLRKGYFKENGDEFTYEIDADYNDEFDINSIKKIIDSEHPMETFSEVLNDYSENVIQYYYDEFITEVENTLATAECEDVRELTDEETEWIREHVHWEYDEDHFLNQHIKTNIYVASASCRNKDFVCDNILNYYGTDGGYWKGDVDKDSCTLWLAKQFGEEENFRKAIMAERASEEEISYDKGFQNPFIDSCMQELYNLPSHMSCLCFLVTMTLGQIIECKQNPKAITVPKTTMCGLYDPWYGGGSLLEIDLPKELTIPTEMVWLICPDGAKVVGYDVDDVYGLVGSCWNASAKIA